MFGVDLVWKEAGACLLAYRLADDGGVAGFKMRRPARRAGDGDEKFLLGKEILFNAVPCKVRADVVD
jgi:hypothetical protein